MSLSRLGIAAALAALLGCMYVPSSDTSESPGNVFSTDPCDKDGAPVADCHPARCVQAANAGRLPPETVCTMECRPGTVDCGYNHCGCATSPSGDKVCALLAGPKPP